MGSVHGLPAPDYQAKMAVPPTPLPSSETIVLGYGKVSVLNDLSSVATPLKATTLAVNQQGSRFTHATLSTETTKTLADGTESKSVHTYKVGIRALATLLNVSVIVVVFKAIFGGLNQLVSDVAVQKNKTITEGLKKTVSDLVVKKDMIGLAKVLMSMRNDPEILKPLLKLLSTSNLAGAVQGDMTKLAKELMSCRNDPEIMKPLLKLLSTSNLTSAVKEDLLKQMLKQIPAENQLTFLLDFQEPLVHSFGTKYSETLLPFQKEHVQQFLILWTGGNRDEAYKHLNKLPKLGSSYLSEQIGLHLEHHGGNLELAKLIVSKEAEKHGKLDPSQFLRESKVSDNFISKFIAEELTKSLKNDSKENNTKFAELLKLPASEEKSRLILSHLSKVTTFTPALKEYSQHLSKEANKHLRRKEDIPGSYVDRPEIKFLISSTILKGITPFLVSPPFSMDIADAAKITNGLIKFANPEKTTGSFKAEVTEFALHLISDEAMDKKLGVEDKAKREVEYKAKLDAEYKIKLDMDLEPVKVQVRDLYEVLQHVHSETTSEAILDDFIEKLQCKTTGEKIVIKQILESQGKELPEGAFSRILTNMSDETREKFLALIE